MNYEKAYNEALERAKQFMSEHPTRAEAGLMVALFPELHESEDERIREFLIDLLSHGTWKKDWPFSPAECVAWLEKQKEPKHDVTDAKSERVIKAARSVLNNWLDGTDCPNVSGDFTELEYAIREYDGEEKAKEQDNEEGDFTIYHPQKNGEGKYECIPFSFYGSLTSFSNDKDLMDFLNESFYDKKECEEWCERENKPELPDCKHKIKKDSVFDYLCDNEKQKEQEPLSPEDKVRHPLYMEGFEAGKEVGRQCEKVFGKQKEQKPAEWSEKDENALKYIHELISFGYSEKFMDEQTAYDMRVWVNKSLRSCPKSTDNWKPSEEQMEALEYVIRDYREDSCNATANYLQEILDHLKNM